MEQLEAQERKVRSTKATLSEQSAKVTLLEAEAQEAKRLVAEGTPHGSDVGEGAGENDRAFSVQSDDELAGGKILMMKWECPKSTWRIMSQTREPGW